MLLIKNDFLTVTTFKNHNLSVGLSVQYDHDDEFLPSYTERGSLKSVHYAYLVC